MKIFTSALLYASLLFCVPVAVEAGQLIAKVDVSEQTMRVYRNGKQIHKWRVSTARKGKYTPRGQWRGKMLSKNHKSSLYNNAPMPYSIFYSGNFAIHGTNQTDKLGQPNSHGCVLLSDRDVIRLYGLVPAGTPVLIRA